MGLHAEIENKINIGLANLFDNNDSALSKYCVLLNLVLCKNTH